MFKKYLLVVTFKYKRVAILTNKDALIKYYILLFKL